MDHREFAPSPPEWLDQPESARRESVSERRDRYLRLAAAARREAAHCGDSVAGGLYRQIAESWETLARETERPH